VIGKILIGLMVLVVLMITVGSCAEETTKTQTDEQKAQTAEVDQKMNGLADEFMDESTKVGFVMQTDKPLGSFQVKPTIWSMMTLEEKEMAVDMMANWCERKCTVPSSAIKIVDGFDGSVLAENSWQGVKVTSK
jgi:hypothetical protein